MYLDSTEFVLDTISMGVVVAILGFAFVFFLLNAYAMYKVASVRGYKNAWIAWIPVINAFLIPQLVEQDVHEKLRGKLTLILVITFFVSFVPFLGFITAIIYSVLIYYAYYTLFNQYTKNSVWYLVLSILLGNLVTWILFLRIAKRGANKNTI